MRKIDRLKKEAMEACKFRNHKMGPWAHLTNGKGWKNYEPRYIAVSDCERCGKSVQCDTRPPANGIDIGGEAVALNCL